MAIRSYQELEVWQRAMSLAEKAYRMTRDFPKEEMFGLTSQIRRAAVSIPANIAEGWSRKGDKEFQQYLRMAQGSLSELETHLLLSQRINLTTSQTIQPLLEETTILGKQLLTLIRKIQARNRK